MNIKKKIAVWCALFAFLVALVPPGSAKADEMGVYNESVGEILSTISDDMLALMDEYHYVVGSDGTHIHILLYNLGSVPVAVQSMNDSGYEKLLGVTSKNVYASGTDYWYNGSKWQTGGTGGVSIFTVNFNGVLYASSLNEFYDKDWNLIADDVPTYSEFMGLDSYRFSQWCADADLNCQASSNESASVIPYSYNDYWHVVRKTSSGKWLLTTIGSTIGQAKMNLRLSEDLGSMKIYEYSGDDSFIISVRQYEYDMDGWKLRNYSTYGYDDFTRGIVELPLSTGINNTVGLAYTSTDIYSSDGLTVYASASEEYAEPLYPDVAPPSADEPTITPTPAPSGGSNTGIMITYKPALSAKVSANSLNMRKEASADSEIVAAFIKTWSLTLHGFVNTSDGVVWYFCTAERDGVTYTGYVMSEYVEIVGSSGSSGGDSESTLDEKLAEALKELEALAIFVARVPMIIGIIFSFMPSWCLVLFGFAFGFLVLKAIVSR